MFKDYNKYILKLIESNSPDTNWGEVLENHKEMIAIIQHERLIHLLVTIFVGISMVLTSLATILSASLLLAILAIPVILLFLGYIFHYRYLENTTQSWYKITDLLRGKTKHN